jgi:hypothetical protein
MVSQDVMQLWKKMLANRVNSFTDKTKTYSIFHNEETWECDCMDWKIRKGSHRYEFQNEKGEKEIIQSCKHVGKFLAQQGLEVFELTGYSKIKIEGK